MNKEEKKSRKRTLINQLNEELQIWKKKINTRRQKKVEKKIWKTK
ncbi:hypothetical protein [Spiroplasma endosymbiont of Lariophagus distinguendus]|nr:hypothetical protein [Spiroplasma endosymbiont of Lariophagus distinguendus]